MAKVFGCKLAFGANQDDIEEFLELIPGATILSFFQATETESAWARVSVPDSAEDSFVILTEDDEMFTSIWKAIVFG